MPWALASITRARLASACGALLLLTIFKSKLSFLILLSAILRGNLNDYI
jgi:hypothetical protein